MLSSTVTHNPSPQHHTRSLDLINLPHDKSRAASQSTVAMPAPRYVLRHHFQANFTVAPLLTGTSCQSTTGVRSPRCLLGAWTRLLYLQERSLPLPLRRSMSIRPCHTVLLQAPATRIRAAIARIHLQWHLRVLQDCAPCAD